MAQRAASRPCRRSKTAVLYNPGERVEGYSNFLWTLLLAAGVRLGCDIVQLSILLALAAALATIVVLWARPDPPGRLRAF